MDNGGHCFPESIIIQAVYLKLRFALSYRDDAQEKKGTTELINIDKSGSNKRLFTDLS